MENHSDLSFERSLESIQRAADACRKAIASLGLGLTQVSEAVSVGDLRKISKAKEKTAQAFADVTTRFGELEVTSRFDEGAYLSSGSYAAELVKVATEKGLLLIASGERLYAPPYEVRVLINERAVMVGKRRVENLRPSVLIEEIKRLRYKNMRVKPEEFLDVLHDAFRYAATKSVDSSERRRVVPLAEIYDLLTILPGTSKDYTIDDFASDVYLLDRSGVAQSKRSKGAALNFVASSGTRSTKVMTVMTDEGVEQKYYAISFGED